ncbi:MAG: aspartate aminotransferase family protein [Bacteriovoracaceae bacterium]|jgi:putrescine aminotransferase|nr:aspartate aminotransferase family protein [Bacteriovoracaceae bacterium]
MNSKKLFGIEDCEQLSVRQVWDLYTQFVNPGQVDLIGSFGFGRDLAESAQGMWIKTKGGREILDFTGGVGVLNHGHNHPEILEARKRFQELNRMEVHKNFFSPYIAGLSHNLAQLLPGDLNVAYFPNSGAESVEGAIKMAYKYHNGTRKSILYADISFHGKLLGAASVTGSPELDFKFPQIPHTYSFEYNNIDSVKTMIASLRNSDGNCDVYAIILEPMNASSLTQCSKEYLLELREICDKEDIILIFDEVYTGWAKTGHLFYFMQHEGLLPDILTMAKSFGGGKASISGYIARDKVFQKAYGSLNDATLHSTTYNGFGEETITAIQAVNIIIRDDYVGKSQAIHNKLYPKLLELKKKYPNIINDVRGSGALNGLTVKRPSGFFNMLSNIVPSKMFRDERFMSKVLTGAIIYELYEEHGILTFFGSNKEIPLIISPSLIVKDEELNLFLTALDKTLAKGMTVLVTKFVKGKFFGSPKEFETHLGPSI